MEFVQPGEEKAWDDAVAVFQYLKVQLLKRGRCFLLKHAQGPDKRQQAKVLQRKIPLDIGKIFFIMRTTKLWNRLLREMVECSSQELLRTWLGRALGNLIQIPTFRSLDQIILTATFQLGLICLHCSSCYLIFKVQCWK